jgi:hypothetical protein
MTGVKPCITVVLGILMATNAFGLLAADPAPSLKSRSARGEVFIGGKLAPQPEPGPEDGGLRLRLVVGPRATAGKEGFEVRLDLMNVSERAVTLQTGWELEEQGDVKDYLEAAASIDTFPQIEPWRGGLAARELRRSPQASQALPAGETLSVRWQTDGKRLKNRVSDPTVVQNPTFPFPGMYAAHATLDVITGQGAVRLRSNEQLVSVGGSRAMPRHTYGRVWSANREKKSATLGLGSLHKVAVGDRFEIPSKTAVWRLTVTEVQPRSSDCTLELASGDDASAEPPRSAHANLVREEARHR